MREIILKPIEYYKDYPSACLLVMIDGLMERAKANLKVCDSSEETLKREVLILGDKSELPLDGFTLIDSQFRAPSVFLNKIDITKTILENNFGPRRTKVIGRFNHGIIVDRNFCPELVSWLVIYDKCEKVIKPLKIVSPIHPQGEFGTRVFQADQIVKASKKSQIFGYIPIPTQLGKDYVLYTPPIPHSSVD